MNHEHLDILMNRAVDGKASPSEREELARALLADPTLRAEYDELMGAHISTVALFERLELPEDFTARVMRRVQPEHVPSDADLTAIIEENDIPVAPALAGGGEPMSSPALAAVTGKTGTGTWKRQARITTILSTVGALSAAAALLLAIGLLTGIIGSNGSKPQTDGTAQGQPGGPAERKGPAPTPAPKSESGTPGEHKQEPGVPDSPKPGEKSPENPAPKGEEEEDHKLPPVEKDPPKEPVKKDDVVQKPGEEKGTTAPENKGTEPKEKVDGEEKKPEATPEKPPVIPEKVQGDPPKSPSEPDNTNPQPPIPQAAVAWGRMFSLPSGRVTLLDETGKPVVDEGGKQVTVDAELELRVGMKFSTSANCVSVFNWHGGGYFSAGRRTSFTLTLNGFTFDEGEMAVDYDGGRAMPVVGFDAYTLWVKSGAVLVEHKTKKKVAISQSSGQSVLKFGEQTLTIEAGCQVVVEFGKMPTAPKAKAFVLPEWCGTARREIDLARVDKLLSTRKLTRDETTRLHDQIGRLARLPHSTFMLVGLMNRVLELEAFSVADLINMLGDVEEAFQGNQELTLDDAFKLGYECTCDVKNYADWSKRFGNRVREFSRKDAIKEREARKAEEERRARDKEGKDQNGGSVKGEKKEESHEGKDALDKNKSGDEPKKEEPKKEEPKDK